MRKGLLFILIAALCFSSCGCSSPTAGMIPDPPMEDVATDAEEVCAEDPGQNEASAAAIPFVLGKYELSLPKVGTFFQFLRSTTGYIVCILVPFVILILHQGLNCVAAFRRYKGEQMAELQAEKEAIEKQRQQSELMMQQLMEMKQQMSAQAPPREDPSMEAMRAELEALRSQLAAQKQDDHSEEAI